MGLRVIRLYGYSATILVFLLAVSCGSPSSQDVAAANREGLQTMQGNVRTALSQTVSTPPSTDPLGQLGQEVQTVLEQIGGTILGGLLNSSGLAIGGCKPTFAFSFTQLDLNFASSSSCNMAGEIALIYSPLQAQVNLGVTQMQFVQSLNLNVDVVLSNTNGNLSLNYKFLNGQIGLGAIPILSSQSLTLNGEMALQLAPQVFVMTSRTNIIENPTGLGVAVVAQFDQETHKPAVHSLQGCLLTSGNGGAVDAGTLGQCISIIQ